MGKKIYIIIILALAVVAGILIYNNLKMKNINIKPIDKEFNSQLEFGIQYYTISGYSNHTSEELALDIQNYLDQNKNDIKNAKMILFYEDSFFSNYKKNMRESARDNEFGGIEGHQDNLVVKVWFDTPGAKPEEHLVIYKDGKIVFDKVK
ncbi:hypothetical protein [Chryseobacterium luteum]|uniref:Uncharacterized protein n=1 Tax=Chryseobacterium luteum TaxID=421531 RepID=A0A085ZVV2_9FLAO|nr:hypothetical protein [Chryseobacterium luteum]KFF08566.1 hypothetical protein IX38_03695 [Chryseobacterium luteum]